MADKRDDLRALVDRVSAFYITDRSMKKQQERMNEALAAGAPDEATAQQYLQAVRRYFTGFQKEAREHLRNVDKRLEALNQVQFNLTAERSVAVKRIEETQAVLSELERTQ